MGYGNVGGVGVGGFGFGGNAIGFYSCPVHFVGHHLAGMLVLISGCPSASCCANLLTQ